MVAEGGEWDGEWGRDLDQGVVEGQRGEDAGGGAEGEGVEGEVQVVDGNGAPVARWWGVHSRPPLLCHPVSLLFLYPFGFDKMNFKPFL